MTVRPKTFNFQHKYNINVKFYKQKCFYTGWNGTGEYFNEAVQLNIKTGWYISIC